MKKLIPIFLMTLSFSALAGFLPKSFEADFVQITKKQRGTSEDPVKVFYKYPSNIYFDVKGDAPILYVCNQEKVWIYDPPWIEGEAGELKVGDSSKYCYSKFFDALANGLKDNELYKVQKSKDSAELNFSKSAEDQLSISKVKLEFSEAITPKTELKDVKKIHIFKKDAKDALTLVVKSLDQKTEIQDKQFQFTPPKNTNVTEIK